MFSLLLGCKSNKGQAPSPDEQTKADKSEEQAKAKTKTSPKVVRMSCLSSDIECTEFRKYSEDSLTDKTKDCKGEWSDKPCPTKNLLGSCLSSSKFSSQSLVKFYYYSKNTPEHERFLKVNALALSCSPPKVFIRAE